MASWGSPRTRCWPPLKTESRENRRREAGTCWCVQLATKLQPVDPKVLGQDDTVHTTEIALASIEMR